MPIRLPSHIYRNRHGTFYFRFVVPRNLRAFINKGEIRFSLETERREEAIIAALPLIAALPRFRQELRRMTDENDFAPLHNASLDTFDVKPAADVDLDPLREIPEIVLPPQYLKTLRELARRQSRQDERIEELERENEELRSKLNKSVTRQSAERTIREANVLGIVKGKNELEAKIRQFPPPPEETPLFSELKAVYLSALTNNRAEGGSKKPPVKSTLEDYESTFDLFVRIMGDLHIGSIDDEMVGKYFGILKRLPANMNNAKEYKGICGVHQ